MFYTKVVGNLVQIMIENNSNEIIVHERTKFSLFASTSLDIYTISIHFRVFLIIHVKIQSMTRKTKPN